MFNFLSLKIKTNSVLRRKGKQNFNIENKIRKEASQRIFAVVPE
jgi:hypothetical protein